MFYNPEKVTTMKTKNYIFALVLSLLSQFSYSQIPVQTICREGINVPINDHATIRDSVLVISGATNVSDVNVRIDNISHTWVSDLSIYLKNNLNTGMRLFNKTGGSGDNFVFTIFDDSASTIIDSAAAPFTGRFRPNQSLNVFNGNYNPSGSWVLTITDTATGDTGFLTKWCLVIQYMTISGVVQTIEIPNTYKLYQNYPNPFNPVTKIKYGLPKNGNVKLTVYDELGKEVDVLVDGYRQANTYEEVFDATNLPSGVYYYRLDADGFSETKKMVIIK